MVHPPSEEILHQLGLEIADQADLHPVLIDQRRPAPEVKRHHGQRFVHRQDEVPGAVDSLAVAERLRHELPQYDAHVFDGVMLVARERWIGAPELFERLLAKYQLAIFTGRARYELDITIGRFAPAIAFDPIICAEDVRVGKPDPDGLLRIRERNPGKRLLYFGDVIDDARSARAAEVPFVGVVAAGHPRRATVLAQFEEEGAVAVIENINQIEDVLA